MYWLAAMTPDGALWRDKFESDWRDFKVWQVLWKPTIEQLKNIPKEFDLISKLEKTYIQSPYNSCTAVWLTHLHLIQNIIDFWNNKLEMDWKNLRSNMWHDLNNPKEWWDYLEVALQTLLKEWIEWTWPKWQPKNFKIDWYAYNTTTSNEEMKYYISQWYPLYMAFIWNEAVYKAMKRWLLDIIINRDQSTWWHCVVWAKYDEDYLYIVNSWSPITGKISSFKISWANLNKAKTIWMLNWRYWIVYDYKDMNDKLYDDYAPWIWTEEYDAVKFMKDKWYMKWYNNKFRPNENLTREEFALVMYRILWNDDSAFESKWTKTKK